MELVSTSFTNEGRIPGEHAFCIPDPETHATFAPNRNPHLAWSNVPPGTASFAIICHDPDVPTKPDDVNQESREVPADLARTDFFHWAVAGLAADLTEIHEGEFSDGVVRRGKEPTVGPYPCLQGLNDYTGWFAGDPDMEGSYYGYDGPCPPWNDSLVHHYVFTLFALDTDDLELPPRFTGQDLRTGVKGHVLAEASLVGTYTLNSRLSG